jgi:SAM-dependent methyltransferase
MTMMELRATFNGIASTYDRTRPEYPGEIFDEMIRYSELSAGAPVLEIGAGTGKASIALAELGYRLTCVEPGNQLAEILRDKLARFPDSSVLVSTFEDADLQGEEFPLLFSAQAFHWVDPTLRLKLAHRALEPGGVLAVMGNAPLPGSEPVHEEIQTAYAEYMGLNDFSTGQRRWYGKRTNPFSVDVEASDLFDTLELRQVHSIHEYETQAYLALLTTHSNHQALPPDRLEKLLAAVGAAIDRDGGMFRVEYVCSVYMTRRLD